MKMRKVVVASVILALFALLPITPIIATAQEPTGTATITSEPILKMTTPTPQTFDEDTSCSEDGTISGWETVTPSSYWLYQCSQCLVTLEGTSTAVPPTAIPTWDGTGTPLPTLEPTATPTPTETPFVPYVIHCGSTDCIQVDDYTAKRYCDGSVMSWSCSLRVTSGWAHVSGSVEGVWTWDSYTNRDVGAKAEFYRKYIGTTTYTFPGAFAKTGTIEIPYTTVPLSTNTTEESVSTRITGLGTGDDAWFEGWLYAYGYPAPTPPPATDMYCASVDGEQDDGEIFGFTGIELGSTYCVDLLPWEISILGVDISIPLFAHICFQNISLGSIYVFGLKLGLDGFVYALGVAWALRNMFIS